MLHFDMPCRITITRQLEFRERRKDDRDVMIFTGIHWRSMWGIQRAPSTEKYYEPSQRTPSTIIEFLPPNVIPLAQLHFEHKVRPKLRAMGVLR